MRKFSTILQQCAKLAGMPLQNRVMPWGEMVRTTARGEFMGNRGLLHDERQEIRRPWREKRWIICELQFKGRARKVMTPGLYTELFFLDEAVALAAGHRPCAECRREKFNEYREAWVRAGLATERPKVREMDGALHAARTGGGGGKANHESAAGGLPDGCVFRSKGSCYLMWKGQALLWSEAGYVEKVMGLNDAMVEVLTPEPSVRCLRAGYRPIVHGSADAL